MIAYLGDSHEEGISEAANNVVNEITGKKVDVTNKGGDSNQKAKVKIKPNSLGFLRVRSGPGRSNSEVAQVKVGEEFVILEESNGWYKIEYEPGKEGWISGSSQYTEKIEPESTNEKSNDTDGNTDTNADSNNDTNKSNGASKVISNPKMSLKL